MKVKKKSALFHIIGNYGNFKIQISFLAIIFQEKEGIRSEILFFQTNFHKMEKIRHKKINGNKNVFFLDVFLRL
jgi:hypothetical protein